MIDFKVKRIAGHVSSPNGIILLFAIAISIIVYLQYFINNPQQLFFADQAILYFPQFVNSCHLFTDGQLFSADFLTNNGASIYSLRPNIPEYYPPYLLTYALFGCGSISGQAKLYVIILMAHSVVCMIYTSKLCKEYMNLDIYVSLFVSLMFILIVGRFANLLPIFYYPACLFPISIYFGLKAYFTGSRQCIIVMPMLCILVLTSGYVPIATNQFFLTLILIFLFIWALSGTVNVRSFLIKVIIPGSVGFLVVLPLYIAYLKYNQIVPGLPNSVWQIAHDHAYNSIDIIRSLSVGFQEGRPIEEWPHITFGILPVALVLLSFFLKCEINNGKTKRIVAVCCSITLFYYLLSFGALSGISDVFYYIAFGIGKMHYYGRFLISSSLLVCIVVGYSLRYVSSVKFSKTFLYTIQFFIVVLFSIAVSATVAIKSNDFKFNYNILAFEFFLLLIFLACLNRISGPAIKILAIVLLLVSGLPNLYSPISAFSHINPPPYKNTLSNSPERLDLFYKYISENSSQDLSLIKYMDLTSSIEKLNGIGPNFPWFRAGKIQISNYMGYELNTSISKDYLALFPYYGYVNFPWALRTGANFVVYDDASLNKYGVEISDWLDGSVGVLDLGYGYRVGKLKSAEGALPYVSVPGEHVYSNGIIKTTSNNNVTVPTRFSTNYSDRVEFVTDSEYPTTVTYMLFPSKYLNVYLDGNLIAKSNNHEQLKFNIPAGLHTVKLKYQENLITIFLGFLGLYLVAYLVTNAVILLNLIKKHWGK